MRNKIREIFDTPISKIAITLTDEKYQEYMEAWGKYSLPETKEVLNELPKTLKEAILHIIPKITEITYDDFRDNKDAKGNGCYRCLISYNSDPIDGGMGPSLKMQWFGILSDYVYQGKKVDKLSEDELKMLSLSLTLETLAMIPCYISKPLGTGDDGNKKYLHELWHKMYQECYPEMYKAMMGKPVEEVETLHPSMKWELDSKASNEKVEKEIVFKNDYYTINKEVKTYTPECQEVIDRVERETRKIHKEMEEADKSLAYVERILTLSYVVFSATFLLYLFLSSSVLLTISICGLGLGFVALKFKIDIQIGNLSLAIKAARIKEDASEEFMRQSISMLVDMKAKLMPDK